MEDLDKRLANETDTSWLDVDFEGDRPVINEEVTDSSINEHQRQFVKYRQLRAEKFPHLAQDDTRIKSEFTEIKKLMKSRLAEQTLLKSMKEVEFLTNEEAVALLGPYSTPGQRKLLFLQRYSQLWPPKLEENFRAFENQLRVVSTQLMSEWSRGDIVYHDPVSSHVTERNKHGLIKTSLSTCQLTPTSVLSSTSIFSGPICL